MPVFETRTGLNYFVGGKLNLGVSFIFLHLTAQRERKKVWDEKNQEEIAKAVKILDDFDQVF